MLHGRTARIATLALGVLAPAATAHAAPLPPVQVPFLSAAPAPSPAPCKARGRTVCVKPAGGRKLAKATSKAKVRRGLGLPGARRLLGRRAAKKLRKADRKLVRGLARPLREPKAAAAAAAKIRRELSASSTATNGRSRQRRSSRIQLQVDACPDPKRTEDPNGIVAVDGRAEYRMAELSHHRGRWILDTLDISLVIGDKGLVDRTAAYAGTVPNLDRDALVVTRTRQLYDPSTGDSDPRFSGHVTFDVLSLDPVVKLRYRNSFDPAFLDRLDAVDTIGPEMTAPDPMRKRAYLTMAEQFAAYVGHELHQVLAEAERNWRTPNRCVKLEMQGPARLSPGETTGDIAGRLTPVGGAGTAEGLYGRYMTFGADYINGGSAQTIATLPLDPAQKWFRYTAPPQPWDDGARPGLDVTALTKGGIGRAPVTFELAERPLAYKILSATYRETIAAHADIPGSACNLSGVPTSVQQGNDMSVGEQPLEPTNRLDRDLDGTLRGQLAAAGTGTASGTVHGCDITVEPPWPACTTPFGGRLGGAVLVNIEIAPRSAIARLSWPMPPLAPNVIDPAKPGCIAAGFDANDPNPLPTQEVRADTFLHAGPQTLRFSKSRSVAGGGRDISSTVSYEIVFQRVDPPAG